ncbi:MAG: RsmF rRNA methyltransferase first C-terminal domain-containing protein, partial [Clostridia bacterium]|nr:RsmF rRNA methyltransferase first C-terminal domain-containing protein [Clostridia bacterium]
EGVGTSVNGCLRLWPHLVKADGHFVAKLVRDGDERPAEPKNIVDKELPKLVKKLADEIGALPDWVRSARLMRFGDYVHAVPGACPDLKGIRIAKPGLTLMRVGRSHVEPMKPLALAAGMTFKRTVDLSEADAKRFLDRETIDISAPDGRTAVCCLGLPIGWAKVVDNKLKPGK